MNTCGRNMNIYYVNMYGIPTQLNKLHSVTYMVFNIHATQCFLLYSILWAFDDALPMLLQVACFIPH